jgi:hypothetical protein
LVSKRLILSLRSTYKYKCSITKIKEKRRKGREEGRVPIDPVLKAWMRALK